MRARRSVEEHGEGRLRRMALVVCAAALPALPRLASADFCLDDAYIHLSYAKSLLLGDGLSYNPGDFETGASSPLWVFALAALGSAAPPAWAVKLLGLTCHLVTALLAMTLAERLVGVPTTVTAAVPAQTHDGHRAGLYAGILVATTPWLLQGAVSGMEVSLTAMLWLAATRASQGLEGPSGSRGAPGPNAAWLGVALGALAYWARPESLAFCGLLSALTWLRQRNAAALAPGLGALLGAFVWSGYLVAVSGHPLPNTYYVKAEGQHWESLRYLLANMPLWQPALTSMAMPVALLLWFRRTRETAAGPRHATSHRRVVELGLLCLGTLGAIAITRKLAPTTLFFHSRHLAPVMWAPGVITGVALAQIDGQWPRRLRLSLALATGITLLVQNGLMAEQEAGVRRLHVDVAHYVGQQLPKDAVLAVEGAGALRYFTPRSMRIVDLVGLNSGAIAHGPRSAAARLCYAATRGTTHVAYLGRWHGAISTFIQLERRKVFEVPRYAQTLPRQPYAVVVANVTGHRQAFALPCMQLARDRGWAQSAP